MELKLIVIISLLFIASIIILKRRTKQIAATKSVLVFQSKISRTMDLATSASSIAMDSISGGVPAWQKLDKTAQIKLAVLLIEKCMVVWEKYTTNQDIIYRDQAVIATCRIDCNLLLSTIIEIGVNVTTSTVVDNQKKLAQFYVEFIGPVIAIQDGIWNPPYPVKKVFFAAYYILKSFIESSDITTSAFYLSGAIQEAIDCILLTKLCSNEEIIDLVEQV